MTRWEERLALEQWREIARMVCIQAGVPSKLIQRMDDEDLAAMNRMIAIIFMEKLGQEANGNPADPIISDDCK